MRMTTQRNHKPETMKTIPRPMHNSLNHKIHSSEKNIIAWNSKKYLNIEKSKIKKKKKSEYGNKEQSREKEKSKSKSKSKSRSKKKTSFQADNLQKEKAKRKNTKLQAEYFVHRDKEKKTGMNSRKKEARKSSDSTSRKKSKIDQYSYLKPQASITKASSPRNPMR